jgi:hypothetical protein
VRTPYRIASTIVAVGAMLPVGIQPASADVKPIAVETAAWFWSAQVAGEAAPGVGYPGTVPKDASGVPAGDLAVAFKGDTTANADGTKTSVPDKETYLAWDIYSVPTGSTVDSFTFTMFVDPAAKNVFAPKVDIPGQGSKGGQPVVVACAPKIGFGEGEGDSFKVKPDDDCADQIFGEFNATTNSYTFDATTYAQDWVDGKDNYGLGIRPTEDAADQYQLSFLPASKVTASISYTLPQPTGPEPVPQTPEAVVPIQPPVDTGTSGYVPQPLPQPQTSPAPAPVVRTTNAPPVAVRNVAANPLRSTHGLSPAFWLALIGGVMLLGTMSLILGDPLAPQAAGRNRVRVGRHRGAVPAGPRPAGVPRPRTV